MPTATFVVAVAFCIDRITKTIALARLPKETTEIIPHLFGLTRHENHGIIANIPIPIPVIIAVSIGVLLVLFFTIKSLEKQGPLGNTIALSLICGGALGNLFDRIMYGHVFDWILLFNTSIVNIADITITLGALWILFTARGHFQKI